MGKVVVDKSKKEYYNEDELKAVLQSNYLIKDTFEMSNWKLLDDQNNPIWEYEQRRESNGRDIIREDYDVLPYTDKMVLLRREFGFNKLFNRQVDSGKITAKIMDYKGKSLTDWLPADDKIFTELFANEKSVNMTSIRYGVDSPHYQNEIN